MLAIGHGPTAKTGGMRGAAWLWVVVLATDSTCTRYVSAAGEGGMACTLGEERNGTGLAENASFVPFVQQQAFDKHNVSLGCAHDVEANWTLSTIGLEVVDGDEPYLYRENASY